MLPGRFMQHRNRMPSNLQYIHLSRVYFLLVENNGHPAAGIYSPADSDSDLPDVAAVYDSSTNNDELGNQLLGFIFWDHSEARDRNGLKDAKDSPPDMDQIPRISGPFTAQFFSNVPDTWMDTPGDDGDAVMVSDNSLV